MSDFQKAIFTFATDWRAVLLVVVVLVVLDVAGWVL